MKDNIIIENKFSYDFNHLKNPRKFGDLLLYQLGEIYCNNSAVVEPHIHNDFFRADLYHLGDGNRLCGQPPDGGEKKRFVCLAPLRKTRNHFR